MRIITWNCNMAFRKKCEKVLIFSPDILVVQECENIEKISFENLSIKPSDSFWFGNNENKGVAIFTFNQYKIIKNPIDHNTNFQFIIPLQIINNDNFIFNLIAVWTQNTNNLDYSTQIWSAIKHYQEFIESKESVIAGDFNTSSVFDKPNKESNHSNLVKKFQEMGIESVFHHFLSETQGEETKPTLYFLRKKEQKFHIDYCFVSKHFQNCFKKIEIGNYDDFIQFSDHMPLICEFDESL